MMLQKKSSSWARLKYAYVLPLAATTVIVFAHPEISTQFEEISNAKINHLASETSINEVKNLAAIGTGIRQNMPEMESDKVTTPQDTVYNMVECMPEFPGGEAALLKYIADQLKYPEEAAEKGIQGRVPCTFTVNKDGSISDIQIVRHANTTGNPVPGIQRTEDPLLEEEAIRVLKTFPKFKPGMTDGKIVRVRYSIPINFRLHPSPKTTTKPAKTDPVDDLDRVFMTVEKMPEFPGGDEALLNYIDANLKYPEEAASKSIQGRVACSFIVNTDGFVSDVQVIRSESPLLNNEAIRILKSLPQFKPGENDGKPVRVKYSIPINFRLPEKTEEAAN